MSEPLQNDEPSTPEEIPSLEQLRELGSAEANTWTITPPGGEAMSLSESAVYYEQQAQERQEHLRIMREEMESEARIRAARVQEGDPSREGEGEDNPDVQAQP